MMFYKDNLSIIRVWRGLSQRDLAGKAKLSQAEISKYESGSMSPDTDKVEILARTLNIPKTLFAESDLVHNTGISFYRTQAKLSLKKLKLIEAEALLQRFQIKRLLTVSDHQLNTPEESSTDPIELAQQIRNHWNVAPGAFPNLCHRLEQHGVIICEQKFNTETLDGFFIDGDVPMIFVNDTLLTDRFLFTVAHELGHLLMHTVASHKNEDEANSFAAELLMPEKDIADDFALERITMERLAELKPKWNVSMQALLYRAGELGYLTESQKRRLWTEMGKLGYRKREPISFDLKAQKPQLISNLLQQRLKHHDFDSAKLADELLISPEDLYALHPIEESKAANNAGKPSYSGTLTGGALLLKESRIVASLLSQGLQEFDVRREILEDNLFQNSSPGTTRRYLNLIFPRFQHLSPQQLRFVAEGDKELSSMTLFYSVLKTNHLLIDFLYEILAEKLQRLDRQLSRQQWMIFLDEKSAEEDSIAEWSEKSKVKIGQVVYRILHEAGYLTDTREAEIICPLIPFELEDSLMASGEEKFLWLMELRNDI